MSLLLINILINVAFVSFFYKRYGYNSISSFLSTLYLITSISSYFFSLNPLFYYSYSNQPIELDALLYLNTINFFLIFPFRKFSIQKIQVIKRINLKLIRQILISFIILNILFNLLDIQAVISGLSSSNLKDLRDATYSDQMNQWWQNPILGILRRLTTAFDPILLITSFFGIIFDNRKKNIYWWGIFVYILNIIRIIGLLGARSIVIFTIIDFIILIVIFNSYISQKIKKRLIVSGIIILSFFISFFISMTVARFSDISAKASTVNESINYSMLLYSGESGINFMGSMYNKENHLLWGYDMFPLFRRLLSLDYIEANRQIATIRFETATNSRAFVFYQLTGALYSNFGKIGTLILVLLLNIFLSRMTKYKMKISFIGIVSIFFLASTVGKGIFYYIPKTEAGNLTYLLLLFFDLLLMKYSNTFEISTFKISKS